MLDLYVNIWYNTNMPAIIGVFVVLLMMSLSGVSATGLTSPQVDSQTYESSFSTASTKSSGVTRISGDDDAESTKVDIVVEEPLIDSRPPSVETVQAQNIEEYTATIRGEVDMYSNQDGLVFSVYGYDLRKVEAIGSRYSEFIKIPESTSDEVKTIVIDISARGNKKYEKRISNLVPDTDYFFMMCLEYLTLSGNKSVICDEPKSFSTNPDNPYSSRFYEPRVRLDRVINVTAGAATISGDVDMNDGIDGWAFFVYGQSQQLIRAVENFDEYNDVKEFGEDLEKKRLAVNVRGQADFVYEIDDLDNDTIYYYRLCVEFDGKKEGMSCSSVSYFTTDSRNRTFVPSAETGVIRVTDNKATFISQLRMNDFNDGIGFLVLGTDQDRIEESIDEDSFSRMRQSGDRFQKILLDSDLDGSDLYYRTLSDLIPNTDYFYRSCIEYIDEDKYNRLDIFLSCSKSKDFSTL
ncbi:MAG: hypothetical protein ACI9BF_000285 [Candidatus Paceibacteria bacterium]|jgi:hypothetical protein